MGLIFKRPFKRQPQGVVQLDRNNPLTQAPGFVWVPQVGREIVNQTPWSKSGSTPPVTKATPAGISTQHTSGAATVSYVDLGTPAGPSADIGLNGPATYIGVFYASAASGVAIAERNDGNAVDAGWVFGYINGDNAGTYGLGFLHEHSSSNVSKGISNAPTAGLNVLIATYDGSQFSSGINVYLNGVLGTVNGQQNGGGTTGSDASRNLYIGRNTFHTSHSHSGTILLAAGFRRLWSAAEVKQFSDNPWQIFRPRPTRIRAAGGLNSYTLACSTGAFTLTGIAASLKYGRKLTASVGTFTFTGIAALLKRGYPLTAATGTFTLTGQAAALRYGRLISASVGTFTLSGQAAALKYGRVFPAAAGTFSLTGQAALLKFGRVASAGAGSFALTGQSAGLFYGRKIPASTGTFTLTGNAVNFISGPRLIANAGTFALTGQDASFATTRRLAAESGAFTLTGFDAGLMPSTTTVLVAESGMFGLTGSDVAFLRSHRLIADTGAFTFTGNAANLVAGSGGIDYDLLAAAVWSFVMSNGKTAHENVVDIHAMLAAAAEVPTLATPIEGAYSSIDLIKVISAVMAGKTSIDSSTPGSATVEFRDVNDTVVRVSADMVGSERVDVNITP